MDYLTIAEAAALLQVSAGRVRTLIAQGRLPAEKKGMQYRILREVLTLFQAHWNRARGWRKGVKRGPRSQSTS